MILNPRYIAISTYYDSYIHHYIRILPPILSPLFFIFCSTRRKDHLTPHAPNMPEQTTTKHVRTSSSSSADPHKKGLSQHTNLVDDESNHTKNHEEPGLFLSLLIYFSWATLITVGRLRDVLANIFSPLQAAATGKNPSEGYAPLVSSFEDFYTRRAYSRINDCWNRPIASCASTYIDVVDRTRVMSPYGSYTPELVENGRKLRCLNLGSYNYLGFGDAHSPTREPVLGALEQYSTTTNSSRVDCGTTQLHVETEQLVARYVGKEAAIIVGMGFGTNTTVINNLCPAGTLIISDANNHSSIVNGARSGGAKIQVFKHNDVEDLERIIRAAIVNGQPDNRGPWDKIFIIVEGIYSMEGETCPLPELVALKKKYNCYLYVDEAHSIGALGATGRGVCEFTGVNPADVDILMGTFTKSFGAVGGYIAADKPIIDFLRSTSMSSLYSSSISPPACQQIISSMKIILGEDGTDLGKQKLAAIVDNANFFRQRLIDYGFLVLGGDGSPVVPVMLYMPGLITQFSKLCLEAGIAVVVVGFPATPILLSRVRFCISAAHTKEQLEDAAKKIYEIGNILGMRWNSGSAFPLLTFNN